MPGNSNLDSTGDAMRFRTTNWDMVIEAADATAPGWSAALEELCQVYWRPVYAFIRKRGHPPEAAQDLTQDFFAHLLQSGFLGKADSERGRFRCLLMSSIDNFLRVEHRNASAQKRGGGWRKLRMDEPEVEHVLEAEMADVATPELLYERQWARTLLARVLADLEREYADAGRGAQFATLKPHLNGEPGALPYREIAAALGASLTGVKVSVHRARQRYQELLRAEIRRLVAHPGDVEDEIHHLLQLLS